MSAKILETMNQKLSFILSAVSNIKENITQEDLEDIELETNVISESLEIEQEILFNETNNNENDVEEMLVELVCIRLVKNVLLQKGYFNDADTDDFNTIATSSSLDEDDIELLIRKYQSVLVYFENLKDEDYYNDIMILLEELING